MVLFIFESLGTSELILIGIVALIFLGPRKLPEMARKIGKMMNELRSTTTEFKETWEREVNFDEEVKALQIKNLEDEPESVSSDAKAEGSEPFDAPEVKQIEASRFEGLTQDSEERSSDSPLEEADSDVKPDDETAETGSDELAKQNWL